MYAVIQINKSNNSMTKLIEVFTKEEAVEEVEYYKTSYAYTKQFEFDYNEIV